MGKESIMKHRLKIAFIAGCITLYSAAALAIPEYVLNPPPYGTQRTYFDKPTGTVVGQFIACGELSSHWGLSNGYSYRDQPIQCP